MIYDMMKMMTVYDMNLMLLDTPTALSRTTRIACSI
jgi:hypothetical protein